MADTNLVSIRGGPIQAPGEPDAGVVQAARDMLARAESGEIDGFVAVYPNSDGSVGHTHAGAVRNISTVGGLSHMVAFLNVEIMKGWVK